VESASSNESLYPAGLCQEAPGFHGELQSAAEGLPWFSLQPQLAELGQYDYLNYGDLWFVFDRIEGRWRKDPAEGRGSKLWERLAAEDGWDGLDEDHGDEPLLDP
jgi:hypothetical protein